MISHLKRGLQQLLMHAGWEDAMCRALKVIRSGEAFHAVKMARIRACNMAMFFFIMPVSSFITFAAVRTSDTFPFIIILTAFLFHTFSEERCVLFNQSPITPGLHD